MKIRAGSEISVRVRVDFAFISQKMHTLKKVHYSFLILTGIYHFYLKLRIEIFKWSGSLHLVKLHVNQPRNSRQVVLISCKAVINVYNIKFNVQRYCDLFHSTSSCTQKFKATLTLFSSEEKCTVRKSSKSIYLSK